MRCPFFNSTYMFDSHMQSLLHDFYGHHFLSTSCMVKKNENVAEHFKDIEEGVYYLFISLKLTDFRL